jgi:hypothetical protein
MAQDPDRNSNTPTGWHWWKSRTADQLNAMRKKGERIINIQRSPTDPGHFDAVLVSNTGVYQRNDGWWFDFSGDQVVAKTKEKNGRITDLKPYTVNGQRLFAFTLIRNEGEAAKGWWWNYDLTPDQITKDINTHGIRLVDLDAYLVNGKTRYSYVGIKNEGVDKKAWWWYPNVDPQFVADRLEEHGARLIDIVVHSQGNLSVIMVKNDGAYWWWGHGRTQTRMEEILATTGSRIVDLESYVVGGERRYAFVSIDNANEESRRLRDLIYRAFSNPKFGENVIRGFLVKQVGGSTLANIAAGLRFQPLSTLKLLPYLYTLIEVDEGKATLDDTTVSWIEATKDDAGTELDDRKYASCLQFGSANTKPGAAKLGDALPTMMWESHNRTLDAILEKYTPDKISARANQLGLTQTVMYYGCPQADKSATLWPSNRSTLYDLAKLFEGVEMLQFVAQDSTRQAFFNNMINGDYDGSSYKSPITGKTSGWNNSFLRNLVKREAGPAKQGIVEDFLKHVVVRGKGGSGGPSSDEFGYSDFLHVTLPFKESGQVVLKSFLVGWFIYRLKTPPGCPESLANDDGVCQAIWKPERDALERFRMELHTTPIRMALATWP